MKKLILGSLILLSAAVQPVRAADVKTLPPEIYARMKTAKHVGKIWISPSWNGALGFTVGKVQVAGEIEDNFTNALDYLPYRLRMYSTLDSPNLLSITVVEMSEMDRGGLGGYSATMGVEGEIVDKDGKVVVAFRTREYNGNRETVLKNFELVMNQIVWSLSRDLGPAFSKALETRQAVNEGSHPSGLVPPPPPQEPPVDVKTRLLRLDDLLKKGLITPEEYKLHKEQILKSL